MTPATQQAAFAHAIHDFPKESCGLVVMIGRKEVYIPCRNDAMSKGEHFAMNAEDYADAEERGDIMSIVHSHPGTSCAASEGDKVSCEETKLPWVIIAVWPGNGPGAAPYVAEWTTIAPSGYLAPLVGRTFVHGVLDCYSLVRDWWSRERGVTLPDFDRDDQWWNRGQNLYLENFEKAGFVNQPFDDLKQFKFEVGDGILMQVKSPTPNHAAIYIGNGVILHHMYGQLSAKTVYGGYWASVTTHIVRRPYEPATSA